MSAGPQLRLRIDGVDETQYLRADRGVTITRGRSDAETLIGPGRVTFTLDNQSGRFTLGRPNSAGVVRVSGQLVELDAWDGAGWSRRFTGYVDSWPVTWDSGQVAVAQVSATDRLKRLAIASAGRTIGTMTDTVQTILLNSEVIKLTHVPNTGHAVLGTPRTDAGRQLRWQGTRGTMWTEFEPGYARDPMVVSEIQSQIVEQIAATSTVWPLNETLGGVTSGETAPALRQPAPYDSWSMGIWPWVRTLPAPASRPTLDTGLGTFAAMWVQVLDAGTPDGVLLPVWNMGPGGRDSAHGGWQVRSTAFTPRLWGGPTWVGRTVALNAGWHLLAINVARTDEGGRVLKFWVDDQLADTSPVVASSGDLRVALGGGGQGVAAPGGDGLAISHMVAIQWRPGGWEVGQGYVPDWIRGMADAGPEGTTERSDLRILRALARLGIDGYQSSEKIVLDEGRAVLNASPGRKPVGDVINGAVAAEGGIWHVDRSGVLRFLPATHRWAVPAATLTVSVEQTEPPLTLDSDGDTSIANEIVATNGLGETVILTDTASKAIYGQRTAAIAIPVDRMALHQTASETLARDAAERLRLRTVTLDVLTQPTLRQAACTLDISSLLTLTDIPPGADTTRAAVWVEGITETIGTDTWTMQFATSPAQLGDTAKYDTSQFDAGRYGI